MSHLIINLRGTSGSGKTTVVRQIMEQAKSVVPIRNPTNIGSDKPYGYEITMPNKLRMYAIGSYENTCGGCDTIKTQAEIIERLEYFAPNGHVLVEGLILSTIYGSVGEWSEPYGDKFIFAYLSTPVKECVKRVLARRKAAGNDKPFNERNTVDRYTTILRNKEIAESKGRRTVMLDWKHPTTQVLELFEKGQ